MKRSPVFLSFSLHDPTPKDISHYDDVSGTPPRPTPRETSCCNYHSHVSRNLMNQHPKLYHTESESLGFDTQPGRLSISLLQHEWHRMSSECHDHANKKAAAQAQKIKAKKAVGMVTSEAGSKGLSTWKGGNKSQAHLSHWASNFHGELVLDSVENLGRLKR